MIKDNKRGSLEDDLRGKIDERGNIGGESHLLGLSSRREGMTFIKIDKIQIIQSEALFSP